MFKIKNISGIGWMIIRCAIFSLLALSYSKAAETLPIFMVFLLATIVRTIIAGGFAVIYLKAIPKCNDFTIMTLRSVFTASGQIIWVYLLKKISLNQAGAISFIAPLVTILFAIIYFKENFSLKKMIATIFGFCGAMIILQPGINIENDINIAIIISMILIWAITDSLIKYQTKFETQTSQWLYSSLFMIFLTLPFSIGDFGQISINNLLWTVLAGILSSANVLTLYKSYQKSDLAIVTPFKFTRLIFTGLLAYFIYGQILDSAQIIGSIIIIAACWYIAKRDKILGG